MKYIDQMFTARNTMLATVLTLLLLSLLLTIGMLTPLIARFATGVEMKMDAGYFNNRAAIPTAIILLLMSICLLRDLGTKKVSVILVAVFGMSLVSLFVSPFNIASIDVSVPALVLALMATLYRIVRSVDRIKKFRSLRSVGAHVIHLGVVLILIGVIFSSGMKVEDSGVLSIDEMVVFDEQGYGIVITDLESGFEGSAYKEYPGSSYVTEIDFDVYRNGAHFDTGQVSYITDLKWGQTYTTTYVNRGLLEELFVAPRGIDESEGKVNLYVRTVPFITSLWTGIYLMAIGIVVLAANEYLISGRRGFVPPKNKKGSKLPRSDLEMRYAEKLEKELESRRK